VIAFGQHMIDALTIGSLYALLGLGIALVFGIMRLVNFAQGELVMVGAYGATLVSGAPWPIVIAVTLLTPILFALAMERAAFRPVRNASEATLLVTSFAVSYLLQSLALLFFTSTPRTVNLAPVLSTSFQVGPLNIPWLNVATVGASVLLLVALNLFLNRTSLGTHMRAAAEDFTTARLLGVRANRVIAVAFAISGLLSGVAAFLTVARTGVVYPSMGLNAVLVAFIATALGGLGSLEGAVLGGYLLGAITILIGAYLPSSLASYTDAFSYTLVIIILVRRPQGLWASNRLKTRV